MIAVGELRDAKSARTLLDALNTGVRGCASTWHADSALDGLYRLEDLLRSGGFVPPRRMITRFVDMIVFMTMTEDRKRAVGDVVFDIGSTRTTSIAWNRSRRDGCPLDAALVVFKSVDARLLCHFVD